MILIIILIIFILQSIYLMKATKQILTNKIELKDIEINLNYKNQIYLVSLATELLNAGISPQAVIKTSLEEVPKFQRSKYETFDEPFDFLSQSIRLIIQSSFEGSKIIENLRQNLKSYQRDHKNQALKQIKKSEVWLLLPLGLCFLPAFMLVAIIPLIGSLISGLIS